jgi:hypothetical protein
LLFIIPILYSTNTKKDAVGRKAHSAVAVFWGTGTHRDKKLKTKNNIPPNKKQAKNNFFRGGPTARG